MKTKQLHILKAKQLIIDALHRYVEHEEHGKVLTEIIKDLEFVHKSREQELQGDMVEDETFIDPEHRIRYEEQWIDALIQDHVKNIAMGYQMKQKENAQNHAGSLGSK